ncbi:hypothetical protein AXE80_00950 [Wenyingzhuangia fucanilytica]|uniref:Uncharacterized protein n=1 Tax=Wenyingzhuangia fucanilytica TaxID=1790137 RepID=A0A1B1Y2H2_9FLAO|nr:hypothetical protein AXE80_00950 [Wenyingzhuangia fucanilytica]
MDTVMVLEIHIGIGGDLFILQVAKEIKLIEATVIHTEQTVLRIADTTRIVTAIVATANTITTIIQTPINRTEELVLRATTKVKVEEPVLHKLALLVTTEALAHQAVAEVALADHTEAIATATGGVKKYIL